MCEAIFGQRQDSRAAYTLVGGGAGDESHLGQPQGKLQVAAG
jgi:hypothetical protein